MTTEEREGLLQRIVRELTRIVETNYRDLGLRPTLQVMASCRREIERVHAVEQDEFAYQQSLALLHSLETRVRDSAARGLTELMLTAGGRHGSSQQETEPSRAAVSGIIGDA